jgi:hypothetical protein
MFALRLVVVVDDLEVGVRPPGRAAAQARRDERVGRGRDLHRRTQMRAGDGIQVPVERAGLLRPDVSRREDDRRVRVGEADIRIGRRRIGVVAPVPSFETRKWAVTVTAGAPDGAAARRRMRANSQLSPTLPMPLPASSFSGWSFGNEPGSVPRRFHTSDVT